MRIRRGRVGDIEEIMTVTRECDGLISHTPYTYWVLLYHLWKSCFVLEHKRKVIAFVLGMQNTSRRSTFFLWQIGVSSRYRLRGHATRLLDHIMRQAITIDCRRVLFTIEHSNRGSRAFFEKFAARKGYTLRRLKRLSLPSTSSGTVGTTLYEMLLC